MSVVKIIDLTFLPINEIPLASPILEGTVIVCFLKLVETLYLNELIELTPQ
ncbi:hypothetical protein FC92_GL001916 [Liquorilactobacillus hordei DSM 19519]|uniref:Uncharacterized protein n=1 Tax=Liquorilactobacillus hordei DSM 19519 TaxID=1423759 RepID=A0A0R1MHW7_9LACO|nr:hypothetical protein FC92_GL001916 [Liquorilactobacillus hordei DSM 19519]